MKKIMACRLGCIRSAHAAARAYNKHENKIARMSQHEFESSEILVHKLHRKVRANVT